LAAWFSSTGLPASEPTLLPISESIVLKKNKKSNNQAPDPANVVE
jgi:hypothetical protein